MKFVENLESRDDPVKPKKGETPNCPGQKNSSANLFFSIYT